MCLDRHSSKVTSYAACKITEFYLSFFFSCYLGVGVSGNFHKIKDLILIPTSVPMVEEILQSGAVPPIFKAFLIQLRFWKGSTKEKETGLCICTSRHSCI